MFSPKMLHAKSRVKSRLLRQGLAADSAGYIPILLKIRSYPKMCCKTTFHQSPKTYQKPLKCDQVSPTASSHPLARRIALAPYAPSRPISGRGGRGCPVLFIFTHPTELWHILVTWHVCVHTISCIYNII